MPTDSVRQNLLYFISYSFQLAQAIKETNINFHTKHTSICINTEINDQTQNQILPLREFYPNKVKLGSTYLVQK